jgi:hypothetical protein
VNRKILSFKLKYIFLVSSSLYYLMFLYCEAMLARHVKDFCLGRKIIWSIYFIKDSNEKKGMREEICVLMWKSAILLFWWENWLFWKFGWVHKKITQNNYRWKNPTDPTKPLNHIKFIFFLKFFLSWFYGPIRLNFRTKT